MSLIPEPMSPAQEAWFDYRKDYGSWHQPELSHRHSAFIDGYEAANPHAEEASYISTYPVGLLKELKTRHARRSAWFYLRNQIKRKSWRAVLKYIFSGYLAEWHYPPMGMVHYRCGVGWTRKAAIRRLGIHIATVNAPELIKNGRKP